MAARPFIGYKRQIEHFLSFISDNSPICGGPTLIEIRKTGGIYLDLKKGLEEREICPIFANKLFVIYKFVKFGWAVLNFIVKEDEVKGISDPKGNASL